VIESLRKIFDEGGRLVTVENALFQGDKNFITAVCLKFEGLTAVFKAMPDDDTLEVTIGQFEVGGDEEIVSASANHPWADLIGGQVCWGWVLTNHQGYTDGVRLEFRDEPLQTLGIVEMIVAASMIHISTVVGDF
jgi:hypothetical protein